MTTCSSCIMRFFSPPHCCCLFLLFVCLFAFSSTLLGFVGLIGLDLCFFCVLLVFQPFVIIFMFSLVLSLFGLYLFHRSCLLSLFTRALCSDLLSLSLSLSFFFFFFFSFLFFNQNQTNLSILLSVFFFSSRFFFL